MHDFNWCAEPEGECAYKYVLGKARVHVCIITNAFHFH